ncbi:globoside alpha-1,3-N-acetylgalactosaminyltransferase 1-like [Erpetoichthys calabaricus]|uniref:globoside alpha-1,3-N-acetylgalactosaminyltransferase 1-like n=1 Tax=Erpetoichthys calabaricus TaxID=27687 RepID=UPI0010A08E0E|nr:globoside alpha-1,3-N-acetylgalactosaminyltransferase 1-like [Erpetoichthys calabaricus]
MGRLSYSKRLTVSRRQFLLVMVLVIAGLIYFLKPIQLSSIPEGSLVKHAMKEKKKDFPLNKTSWGAPVVWGDSPESKNVRQKFINRSPTVGLAVFAIGTYSQYLQRFLASAEEYFLAEHLVTYYILTDNLRGIPSITLGGGREIKPFYIAERPDWVHLSKMRMSLLSSIIKELLKDEVDYLFCMDVDQVFINPVGSEILGNLVATLHPEYYNKPIDLYPYELNMDSKAYVSISEGDYYYYTSELYGGKCHEVYQLTLVCSQYILQDMEINYHALLFEESYLNKYLIQRKPTRILSPEYNWLKSNKDSKEIQVKRILSLQR